MAFYNEGDSNKIIGVGKQTLEQGAVRSGNIIETEQVEQAVEASVTQATKDLEETIEQTIVGVSGDMCLGLMTTARVVRGNTQQVSQEELDTLTKRITESAFNEANTKILQATGNENVDLELITSTPVYTKINEKYTSRPLGTTAESIELALYCAFSPTYHVKTIQKIAKRSGLSLLAISSEMYAFVTALKFAKGAHLDCVIVDMGSDTTDIGVVFGGGIVTTQTLNIGGKHFTEGISQKMGITYREADNIKKSYAQGKLAKSESLIVQTCLQEVLEVWLDGVQLTFAEFTGVKTFSPDVYLVGGGTQLPDVLEILEKEPWTHSIPFKNPPEFNQITMADLTTKVSDATGRAQFGEFTLPAALSIVFLEMKGEEI